MATFGSRLKRLREERRWEQKDLATRANVPYMTIYRLEAGSHRTPRMDIAVKLARTLGVSLDVLCGMYEDDKDSERNPAAVA